jgi:hypothetical protein
LCVFKQFTFVSNGYVPFFPKTRTILSLNEAIAALNPNVSIKFALGVSLFGNALLSLGTERHLPLYKAAWHGEVNLRTCDCGTRIIGGFAAKAQTSIHNK